MSSLRLAVGILCVVIASGTGALAIAQDGEHREFRPATQGASANRIRPNRLQRELSVAVPVSDPADPLPDQDGPTAASIISSPEDCLDGCCRGCCYDPCPSIYGQVEALYMMRDPQFTRQPIVVDANTGTTFLSTSDLDFDFNPGVRATVGMRVCGNRMLEVSYFGLFDETASASALTTGPNAFLIFPGNLAGNVFVDMDRVDVDYSSSVHSFEANLPCCCGCCEQCGCDQCGCDDCHAGCGGGVVSCRSRTWFVGFRYLNLDEELNISAQRIVAGGVETGAYNIRTSNNLYGVQVGARLRRTWGRFGWDASGKAGIFGNDVEQEQSVTDFPNFPLRPAVSSSRGEVAFLAEANLSALYRLTDVWNARAGYTAIWIEGLALAPDQLDFNFAAAQGGSQLQSNGGMFLHGVNVGLEARW